MKKTKRDFLENLKTGLNLDLTKLYRFQAPMLLNRDTSQQYVVGNIIDGELWLLTQSYAPQIAPISDPSARFRVFVSGESSDMSSLVYIWEHTTKFHAEPLQLFCLKDLGVENLDSLRE